MPNIKSAIKRVKITASKTLQNSMVKSALKTSVKKFESAFKVGDAENVQVTFTKATKLIDKAVAKGVLHKNTAARKKSAIAKKVNKTKAVNA